MVANTEKIVSTPVAIFDGHDPEFKAHNEFAHPSSPPRLSAPALNWHFAVWRGDLKSDRAIYRMVRTILNDARFDVVNINGKPEKDQKAIQLGRVAFKRQAGGWKPELKSDRGNPFTLGRLQCSFRWRTGQLIKFSMEMHQEFTAITMWMPAFSYTDRGKRGLLCRQQIGGRDDPQLRDHFGQLMFVMNGGIKEQDRLKRADIQRNIEDYLDISLARLADDPSDATIGRLFRATAQSLYSDIWKSLARDLGADSRVKFRPFAEFRSIILPDRFPFCRRDMIGDAGAMPSSDLPPRFTPREAQTVMQRMDQFLEAEAGDRAELTGSTFLNRRAVYGSSLGATLTDDNHKDRFRSARFLMVIKPSSRWQLGRLVERLNMLGTYRLASLRNLSAINHASTRMRKLGNRIVGFEREPVDRAASYLASLNAFYSDFAASGDGMVGGLNYRVDRARYYVDSFNRIVPDLRIGRIEGFQPYNEFIVRRYGAIWDRISRVGDRYARLAKRLDLLSSRHNALEQREQTIRVADQAKQQAKQAKEQTSLLHTAHNVELVILAYYLAQLSKGPMSKTGLSFGEYNYITALLIVPLLALVLRPHFLMSAHRSVGGSEPAHHGIAPVADAVPQPVRATDSAQHEHLNFGKLVVFALLFWLLAAAALFFENGPASPVVPRQPPNVGAVAPAPSSSDNQAIKH